MLWLKLCTENKKDQYLRFFLGYHHPLGDTRSELQLCCVTAVPLFKSELFPETDMMAVPSRAISQFIKNLYRNIYVFDFQKPFYKVFLFERKNCRNKRRIVQSKAQWLELVIQLIIPPLATLWLSFQCTHVPACAGQPSCSSRSIIHSMESFVPYLLALSYC